MNVNVNMLSGPDIKVKGIPFLLTAEGIDPLEIEPIKGKNITLESNGTIDLNPEINRTGLDSKKAYESIEEKGYYIGSGAINIDEK